MNKKIVLFIIIFVISLFAFSYTFAANNVVNDVRNVIGGAENAVEDAGKGIDGSCLQESECFRLLIHPRYQSANQKHGSFYE